MQQLLTSTLAYLAQQSSHHGSADPWDALDELIWFCERLEDQILMRGASIRRDVGEKVVS